MKSSSGLDISISVDLRDKLKFLKKLKQSCSKEVINFLGYAVHLKTDEYQSKSDYHLICFCLRCSHLKAVIATSLLSKIFLSFIKTYRVNNVSI